MKRFTILFLAGLLALATTGCKNETPKTAEPAKEQPQVAAPAAAGKSGSVTETMNSGGYTYVQVDTGTETFWAAAPEFVVAVGDPVIVPEGMAMQDHHSKTLDRTFPVIYFVDSVVVGGEMKAAAPAAQAGMPAGHPGTEHTKPAVDSAGVDLSGITKAAGGKSVEEVFAEKDALSGKEVTVRGKIVKFSPDIMGTNWLHIQDGTGGAGTNDLTVTSNSLAQVGDLVVIKGIVTANKDFGFGYKYDVIIENAEVTTE